MDDLVIFDLDDTLVITKSIETFRKNRKWGEIKYHLNETYILEQMKKWYNEFLKRNYKIVVVTSSPKKYAEQILNYHNLKFDLIIGYHDTKLHKPYCDPYKKVIDFFSEYNNVVIIGNEIKDMLAATELSKKYNIKTKNYLFNASEKELSQNENLIKKNEYIIL